MTRVMCLLLFVFNPSDTRIKYNRVLTYNQIEDRIMENTIETNESVTIKITIEVIPGRKKEEVAAVKMPVVEVPPKEPIVEVDAPINEPEMVFEPMTTTPTPEKKKRAYTKKTKEVAPVEILNENPAPIGTPDTKPIVPVTPAASTTNKVTARLAQMIRFYCKASGIETSTITIAHLKEKAFDIVENVSDDVITEAIKEASGK